MKTTRGALILLAVWLITLGGLGIAIQRQLTVGADLRLFLPQPKTPQQQLLLNELGEGPASRILVVALSGAPSDQLAAASRMLTASLAAKPEFRLVANGEISLDSIPDALWSYRYLLSPTFDARSLNAENLRTDLTARIRDLSSPAGAFLEPIVQRDPTLEVLKLLEYWQPSQQPRREYDVWFDRSGKTALLLVESKAPAFDPDGQQAALDLIRKEFDVVRAETNAQIEVSGVGVFSALMKNRTQNEAQWLGGIATLAMIVLLCVAYRRFSFVILSALPLASAGVVGLLAVAAAFDATHGITLAFGFTLIGVAQDYPLHLLSHRTADVPIEETASKLWPTLATGVASTCIAYLTFFFSGVVGLAQLATFTVAGLCAAALTTRFILPHLVEQGGIDYGEEGYLANIGEKIASLPHFYKTLAVLLTASVAVLFFSAQPYWQNDLSKLTPVPPALLARDQSLRNELGTADVRYLFAVNAGDEAAARVRLETLDNGLRSLVDLGAIKSYDHIAKYVPSTQLQLQRQRLLPTQGDLRAALDRALVGLEFRSDVFEPFLADVERARQLPPLALSDLRETPLAARTDMLVAKSGDRVSALITLTGVADWHALQNFAEASGRDVLFLDLKGASESLVAEQRSWILWSLSIAAVLLVVVVAIALREIRRIVRVLAPMALTTLFILALLHGIGVSLSLFHLISLVLAAGLGLDYALFFEHAAHDPREQRRTLHAVLVCSASTLLVFGLLSFSTLPVLQTIGVTVTLGVIGNFILALLITRKSPESRQAEHDRA
jgi:predicted exporter